jgi:hypothetical protein
MQNHRPSATPSGHESSGYLFPLDLVDDPLDPILEILFPDEFLERDQLELFHERGSIFTRHTLQHLIDPNILTPPDSRISVAPNPPNNEGVGVVADLLRQLFYVGLFAKAELDTDRISIKQDISRPPSERILHVQRRNLHGVYRVTKVYGWISGEFIPHSNAFAVEKEVIEPMAEDIHCQVELRHLPSGKSGSKQVRMNLVEKLFNRCDSDRGRVELVPEGWYSPVTGISPDMQRTFANIANSVTLIGDLVVGMHTPLILQQVGYSRYLRL